MPNALVIVESPAKARTIAGFLGSGYTVKASMGHIRDLPTKGLSVDVDNGFKVDYEINANKKNVIAELRAALKNADELYLATDEDREGEAISWHLLEVLKPKVPVKRMVFHEITQAAIERAISEGRDVDYGLVDAQESRRIVDRLFGYPVSEVCWRKVRPKLSAGRVQSPAVRLVVERERERMRFTAAPYWDIEAAFPTTPGFTAGLSTVDGARVAEGKDFTPDGTTKTADVVVLDEVGVRALADALADSSFSVAGVDESPYRSRPKPPFITSTLQQVGGSRLRMSASQVMRVAQGLYERGYITYMRTDSTTLSAEAVAAARSQIESLFGREYVLDAPRNYAKKAKNAQEAHEAIRPSGDSWRTPDQLRGELGGDDLRLYELVWQRTLASQMPDATGRTVSLTITATAAGGSETTWSASGTTITFPGYRRVYGFGDDDAAADGEDSAAVLPALAVGDALPQPALEPKGHSTQPPARFTEATLVKALEENGIGRPSTYASIMERIQDNYVWKKGQALVPNTDAFAVTNLLTGHFTSLVDYDFTARMEDDLDEIAGGRAEREPWLRKFWFGNGVAGLATLKENALEQADPAAINCIATYDIDGRSVELRNGRYGPFLRDGDETRGVPEEMPLDELTVERVREIMAAPKGAEPIGTDPESGLPVYAKSGMYGPYVQLGDPETLPDGQKPKMASLFKTMSLTDITVDDALRLLTIPRVVGQHPSDSGEIIARNGKFGPYLTWGDETRSLDTEEQLLTVTVDDAVTILAQPKTFGRKKAAPAPPLKELGTDPVSGNPIVLKDGRFGPYVTDGIDNQSLKRGDAIDEVTHECAVELLAQRREYLANNPQAARKAAKKAAKKGAPKKAAAKKKAPAKKKAAAKKQP
ncbi:MAG: topoisomerase [Acidimicrobiaceae bacterium]